MQKNNKKVPAAAIAAIATIVAVVVFIPLVYLPYKENKPMYDEKHAEAVAEMEKYDNAILDQVNIEKNIDELQKEWDEFQKEMFVDAYSNLEDIQKKCDEIGVRMTAFTRGDETQDESESYSSTGNPLYYVTLNMSMYVSEEELLELLTYIEQESVGCYYVKTLDASTVDKADDLGAFTIKEGDLNVRMQVYLYYYNTKITIDPASLETDTDTEAAE